MLLGLPTVTQASTPTGFTAIYKVLQGDAAIGQATVNLHAGANGEWIYSKDVKGTAGIAAVLGADVSETSHFRWKGNVPEAISYEYELKSALKNKHRDLHVDWEAKQVSVDDGRGKKTYASVPGMVERNTTPLALGLALQSDKQKIELPVAVKQEVQTQSFKVTDKQAVQVPAGNFDAVRVDRTDAERGFSAWYVPGKYLLPVKLSQSDGGDLTMELVSYKQQP